MITSPGPRPVSLACLPGSNQLLARADKLGCQLLTDLKLNYCYQESTQNLGPPALPADKLWMPDFLDWCPCFVLSLVFVVSIGFWNENQTISMNRICTNNYEKILSWKLLALDTHSDIEFSSRIIYFRYNLLLTLLIYCLQRPDPSCLCCLCFKWYKI